MGTDTVQDPDHLADTIDQGRALVRAIEALEAIVPSSGLERLMARVLVEAYRRRLRAFIGDCLYGLATVSCARVRASRTLRRGC